MPGFPPKLLHAYRWGTIPLDKPIIDMREGLIGRGIL